MKITVIQVNNNILGIRNRLKYIEEQIKNIDETDFVILTELSTSSYIPNQKIWQYAESNGELTKEWATEIARKYNIYIGAGFVEKAENDIYNSYLIANSDGILGTLEKVSLNLIFLREESLVILSKHHLEKLLFQYVLTLIKKHFMIQ